jgi:hypothetical protein
MTASTDIINSAKERGWLVVGWFTPDYQTLAQTFADNLCRIDIPCHLFGKPAGNGWDTSPKPSVVLEAMDRYPRKTIILMDVDCIVDGDISLLSELDCDVSFRLSARRRRHERITVQASSRVMVVKPTARARQFISDWAHCCEGPEPNDEVNLLYAYLKNGDVSHVQPPECFQAWDISDENAPADTVIWHNSAHAQNEPLTLKKIVRAFEKPFRSGRTKAIKAAGARFGRPAIG